MKKIFKNLTGIIIASSLFFNPTFKQSDFKEKEFFNKVASIRESLDEIKDLNYIREKHDYWKNPNETLNDKGGDCEDFAILLKDKLDKKNIKSKLVYGKLKKTSKNSHVWISFNTEFGNYIIDPSPKIRFFEKRKNLLKTYPNLLYKEKEIPDYIMDKINEYESRNKVKLNFKHYQ